MHPVNAASQSAGERPTSVPGSQPLRFLRTARHLRAQQIAYRLLYRLRSPRIVGVAALGRRVWARRWQQPALLAPTLTSPLTFEFLGERGSWRDTSSWNDPSRAKLWLYHLHYLDDLNARGFAERAAAHVELVERWIADNPPGHGVGWEPYPLSLRIVNLVKWLDRQPSAEQRWLDSLATQAAALAQRIEYHLLGNHLFANGKALVFAGAFLAGTAADGWLRRGLAILEREIPEQFLADGGHFERSPMYHATLTTDLCDLVQLADVSGLPALRDRRAAWVKVLARALAWLDAMTHPDGEIAFFNDAACGIAPRPADLRAYAESLIGAVAGADAPSFALQPLAASGYLRVDLPQDGAAIVDAAPLGPDYLPAHGHADTLAFELSLFGARVFVNSGTSCYGESEERLRQRGTAAHNTVVIDGENSSEVWAGFRVARRARPTLHEAVQRDGRIVIEASHDGYRRLRGRNVHRRRFTFEPAALRIEDAIEGPFQSAVGYLHLHPDVTVEAIDPGARAARLRLAGGQTLDLAVSGARLAVEPGTWHPRFGASVPTRVLVLRFESAEVTTAMRWRGEP
jgi:uncharacterized heparinase superfamily protein